MEDVSSIHIGLGIALLVAHFTVTIKIAMWSWKLYEMHNKFDDDGKPLWYVPTRLPDSFSKLAKAIDKHTSVTENQSKLIIELVREIKKIPREVVKELVYHKGSK